MTTLRTFTSELAEVKLRELIVYICERRITARSFGTSQLNTLLCLSDFLHSAGTANRSPAPIMSSPSMDPGWSSLNCTWIR